MTGLSKISLPLARQIVSTLCEMATAETLDSLQTQTIDIVASLPETVTLEERLSLLLTALGAVNDESDGDIVVSVDFAGLLESLTQAAQGELRDKLDQATFELELADVACTGEKQLSTFLAEDLKAANERIADLESLVASLKASRADLLTVVGLDDTVPQTVREPQPLDEEDPPTQRFVRSFREPLFTDI